MTQKLNCKTNAAGWVPSSGNRTAQAFSQPGKGVTPMANANRYGVAHLTAAAAMKQNKQM